MEREIDPLRDLSSLWKLFRIVRQVRPNIVDTSTPKASLLVGIAAWLARVPCRIYSQRGLRLETATGIKRVILWSAEWITCWCAHQVVCLSPSIREKSIALKLVPREKTVVLKAGGTGVDLEHFSPRDRGSPEVQNLMRELGIPTDVRTIGFVGRFVKDKGLRQLIEAFEKVRKVFPDLRLLLLGEFEDGDPVEPEVRKYIESTAAVIRPGLVPDTALYYSVMDVLASPTYREGFGQVSAEAQASGIPVVTTLATGAVDSVIDGVTGFLVPVADSHALADSLTKLLANDELRWQMGRAGRAWMEREFGQEAIWEAQTQFYREMLPRDPGARAKAQRQEEAAKRAFDICISACAFVLLSPLFAMVAFMVRVFLGGPVLFRQKRPGRNAQTFTLLKFRTMSEARGTNGELLEDAQRLTKFGTFLRSTSLDELPELINVMQGDMSLVGPRPLLPAYLTRYTTEEMRRHEVKPGITGWAQVNGRNALNWDEKFALDVWYVEHQSFWLDLRILARTVWQVIKREGISGAGHATMPEFLGSQAEQKQRIT
jgi:lipopolysaccharide/colanic/teichoic acid biosynthesis glycosyltransferase/glycosyltransferase involved in cell wall biosynthesis